MIIEADTKAEVEDVIKGDIYYKEGVWDASKVCIRKKYLAFYLGVLVQGRYADCDGWIDADISFQECY